MRKAAMTMAAFFCAVGRVRVLGVRHFPCSVEVIFSPALVVGSVLIGGAKFKEDGLDGWVVVK
ncbi:hypothetical protein D3C77_810020 [compost metagenome]